jgi:hypothetical protein
VPVDTQAAMAEASPLILEARHLEDLALAVGGGVTLTPTLEAAFRASVTPEAAASGSTAGTHGATLQRPYLVTAPGAGGSAVQTSAGQDSAGEARSAPSALGSAHVAEHAIRHWRKTVNRQSRASHRVQRMSAP